MHMDPYQALKFIIYLTDTTKENGAFRYVPNTVRLGRALREEFCKDDEGRRDAYVLIIISLLRIRMRM